MVMLALIIAGEAVFALPFHLARFFRPTVLDVFQLTNTELGAAQAAYGVFAMLSYFPGGPLADRFPARKLLAMSLWTTAAGGLYLATFPGYRGAAVLWGFFGVTTILFFWAALIRATRDWGGTDVQGRAYGLLDGGRGALSSILASAGVWVFAVAFPDGYDAASFAEKQEAMKIVILGYTAVTAAAGVLAWFVIADGRGADDSSLNMWRPGMESARAHIARALRMPAVWLQAGIIVCAYVGYKGFDFYSLYAVQGYGLDEVEGAAVVTLASWMRPIAALAAGVLGDRYTISRMTVISFVILLISHLYFALTTPQLGAAWILLGNTLLTCTAIFGLRGLYFALFEEAKVPPALTGTAVGIVSVIGFTPEIFVPWVGGILLDRSPGLPGHQDLFLFFSAFSAIGVGVSLAMNRLIHTRARNVAAT
jgi:nitrate/nitrite transporter NarK